MIENFNTLMSMVLAALAGWAVMSHRVRDGVVVKSGLILVAVGFIGAALVALDSGDHNSLASAHALVYVGLLVCALGYLLRSRRHRTRRTSRRLSDWVDLA